MFRGTRALGRRLKAVAALIQKVMAQVLAAVAGMAVAVEAQLQVCALEQRLGLVRYLVKQALPSKAQPVAVVTILEAWFK
jgi:hypothetical protein